MGGKVSSEFIFTILKPVLIFFTELSFVILDQNWKIQFVKTIEIGSIWKICSTKFIFCRFYVVLLSRCAIRAKNRNMKSWFSHLIVWTCFYMCNKVISFRCTLVCWKKNTFYTNYFIIVSALIFQIWLLRKQITRN